MHKAKHTLVIALLLLVKIYNVKGDYILLLAIAIYGYCIEYI